MPIYDFVCEDCGPFERRRSFAEAGDPVTCPSCGGEASRVYSVPYTRRLSTALSNAMNRAEKIAHEPEVGRQPARGTWPGARYRPGNAGNCGHNH